MAIYYAGSTGKQGAASQLPSCSRRFSGFYCVLFINPCEEWEEEYFRIMLSVRELSHNVNLWHQQIWTCAWPEGVRRGQRWQRGTLCLLIWCINVANDTRNLLPQGCSGTWQQLRGLYTAFGLWFLVSSRPALWGMELPQESWKPTHSL